MEFMDPERLPKPTSNEREELNYQDHAAIRRIARFICHPLKSLGLTLDNLGAGMGMETMPSPRTDEAEAPKIRRIQ